MSAGRAIAIVPVRVESQRLPRKALLEESGKPLFLHTWEQAAEAFGRERAFIATDSDEIAEAAARAEAPVVRTTASPRTGSERVAEACRAVHVAGRELEPDDVVVNVQGDWPEVSPKDLRGLGIYLLTHDDMPTATLAAPLTDHERAADADVVKVVRARPTPTSDGAARALYFSRAPIPFPRNASDYRTLRHIGVYAFRRSVLARLDEFESSGLAECESLEQLRLIENGIDMAVLDATGDPWGIESRADYEAFLQRHRARGEA